MSINWAVIKAEIIDHIYKHESELMLEDLYSLTGFSNELVKQAIDYLIQDNFVRAENHGEFALTQKAQQMVKDAIRKSGVCG